MMNALEQVCKAYRKFVSRLEPVSSGENVHVTSVKDLRHPIRSRMRDQTCFNLPEMARKNG